MHFLLTCNAGLEAIAKKEIIKQGGTITETKDRLVFFSGDKDLIAKINLWSRVGNKLYIILNKQEKVNNFDKLYDSIFSIKWGEIIPKDFPILAKATSIKSDLTSTPAIQKITKKSIVDKITNKSGEFLKEDQKLPEVEIFSFLIENEAYILLNTTGTTLHKRGYRVETGEAPIKETLAAGLVLLSNWNFKKPLTDFCCGSGTIAIEAAMIARNIAPGLNRFFAFEDYNLMSEDEFEDIREEAKRSMYNNKYNIIATDIDPEMIEIAKENAKKAGVLDTINFNQKDLRSYKNDKLEGTILSNPPYGIRLKPDDLANLYKNISTILEKNKEVNGGIITSYMDFEKFINKKNYKNRKLYNGNELCYFYSKKSTFKK